MKESTFRVILGLWLLVALSFELHIMTLALVGLLLFEGMTNWRIPLLLCRLRGELPPTDLSINTQHWIPFDAERLQRLVIALFLMSAYLLFPQYLWWLPWFIAFSLLAGGLTEICPVVLILHWAGFR